MLHYDEAETVGASVAVRARPHSQQRAGERLLAMAPVRLRRAIRFIDSKIDQPLRVNDIAAAAGMSQFHFARCFKRETGRTPYQYVIWRRTLRAADLLDDPDIPLVEVALASGFGSQAHFNQTFRRLMGDTPGKWRRNRTG